MGRGFATEVALAVPRYGFERAGLTRVLGVADAGNLASRRVLEKIGMTFQGYFPNAGRREARYEIRPGTSKGFRRQRGADGQERKTRCASAPDPADPNRHVHKLREAAGQRFEGGQLRGGVPRIHRG